MLDPRKLLDEEFTHLGDDPEAVQLRRYMTACEEGEAAENEFAILHPTVHLQRRDRLRLLEAKLRESMHRARAEGDT